MGSNETLTWYGTGVVDCLWGDVLSLRVRQYTLGDRVLRVGLKGGRYLEKFTFFDIESDDLGHFHLTFRQSPGLIESDNINTSEGLKRCPTLKEHAALGRGCER